MFNSKSIFSSNTIPDRKNSGFKKSLKISKQNFTEHKMFDSKRKGIQLGKTFKKVGKGVMRGSVSAKMPKSSSISPDPEEFDRMLSSLVGNKKKKTMFGSKSI